MYAEVFPSESSFIVSVLSNVKFDVRAIDTPTGTPTPVRCSPAWIAKVASPRRCAFVAFFIGASGLRAHRANRKRQFGAPRRCNARRSSRGGALFFFYRRAEGS